MIKLIATDVDGTLVKDGTMQIDPEYMTVIKELVQKGIIFAVCSGRQFISERKLFAPIKDQLLYITDGGTVVRTPQEILMVHTMPRDVWSGMCRMVQEQMPHCDCFVATPDYCLAEDAGSRMFHWLRDSYGYDIREAERLADRLPQICLRGNVCAALYPGMERQGTACRRRQRVDGLQSAWCK